MMNRSNGFETLSQSTLGQSTGRQNQPQPEFSEINIIWHHAVRYSAHAVSQVENLGRQAQDEIPLFLSIPDKKHVARVAMQHRKPISPHRPRWARTLFPGRG